VAECEKVGPKDSGTPAVRVGVAVVPTLEERFT
jgi:hypothetical protein